MQIFNYADGGKAADIAYMNWTNAHLEGRGFVINRIGQTYKLHFAGCGHFYKDPNERKLTDNPKTCLENLDEVESWEHENGSITLDPCQSCKPR